METVFRRVLWTVVTGLWPAMAGAGAELHAHLGHLWLPCAVIEALCAVALGMRQARARERAAERERADARERLAGLEEQVAAYGDALAVMTAYGRPGGLPAARTAGGDAGTCQQPGTRLRLVPGQGKRG